MNNLLKMMEMGLIVRNFIHENDVNSKVLKKDGKSKAINNHEKKTQSQQKQQELVQTDDDNNSIGMDNGMDLDLNLDERESPEDRMEIFPKSSESSSDESNGTVISETDYDYDSDSNEKIKTNSISKLTADAYSFAYRGLSTYKAIEVDNLSNYTNELIENE